MEGHLLNMKSGSPNWRILMMKRSVGEKSALENSSTAVEAKGLKVCLDVHGS